MNRWTLIPCLILLITTLTTIAALGTWKDVFINTVAEAEGLIGVYNALCFAKTHVKYNKIC